MGAIFVNMGIFVVQVELLNSNHCAIRKVSQHFGKKMGKKLKLGAKWSIFGHCSAPGRTWAQ